MEIIRLFSNKFEEELFTKFSFNTYQQDIINIHNSFAGIRESDDEIYLLSDSISSKPLFYSIDNVGEKKKIYISDDACKIAFTVKYQVDQSLKNFFLKSGYVGANRTLFSNIYTLLPGQCIRINKISGKIKEENYFNLDYTVPTNTDISDEELL